METNATEALRIGVGLFVFVIALTVSILLMSTLLNVTNISSKVVKNEGITNALQITR